MKNRKAKKGFTIIELVIVIAVIGILAGVLIPTFSNVISEANETAAMEDAKNAYTNYLIYHGTEAAKNICIKVVKNGTNYYFHVVNGQFEPEVATDSTDTTSATWYTTTVTNGTFSNLETAAAAAHTAHTTASN